MATSSRSPAAPPVAPPAVAAQSAASALGPRLPFPESIPPESAYAAPDADVSLRVGDLLEGRYQIEAPIGEGGVGVVYRALQIKLHRRVAVKLLQQETLGEEALRPRFQQEALTLAALSHPHIVTLQDYGVVRGRPFLVMELLEGRTLRQIIDEEAPLAPQRALGLMRQLLLALAYAHALGVVHRDLKPANMIVQALPSYEHVKVLDFGMVKLLPGSALARDEPLTRQGFTFGTPAYMSPEHVLGEDVDVRSDLYAVGVLLFELLTRHKPFDGEVQDVLRHHVNTPVPQLGEVHAPLAELPELQELVERAMAKPRDQRFAGADEMLGAIDELLGSGLLAELPDPDALAGDLSADARARSIRKLRETLELAASALGGYARSSRDAWRDKAAPQLLRAQRELRVVAARLAPKLRGLSEAAWDQLRPQLIRAAERVARVALAAKSRVETRVHEAMHGAGRAEPLSLPSSASIALSADATIVDLPRFATQPASAHDSLTREGGAEPESIDELARDGARALGADGRRVAVLPPFAGETAEPLTLTRRVETDASS